jgi:hypothetical protein
MLDWLDEVIDDDLFAVYEGTVFHRGRSAVAARKARTLGSCVRRTHRLAPVDGGQCGRPEELAPSGTIRIYKIKTGL